MTEDRTTREDAMGERDAPATTSGLALDDFTATLDRCQWSLYTFLRGIVGDGEQARDLMQDTFCAAWQQAQGGVPPFDAGRAEGEMRRWLFHVAYHRAVSGLRRGRLIHWQ